jgi:hypothetical protein
MYNRSAVIALAAITLFGALYTSSPISLFVEGAIIGEVSCSPQGGGKTYCCASVSDKGDYGDTTTTYCTTCDDTNPPSNCTPREKPKAIVNPGRDLSNILEGSVLEQPTTTPKLHKDVTPESEGLEEPNTNQQNNNVFEKEQGLLEEQAENDKTFSRANISAPD